MYRYSLLDPYTSVLFIYCSTFTRNLLSLPSPRPCLGLPPAICCNIVSMSSRPPMSSLGDLGCCPPSPPDRHAPLVASRLSKSLSRISDPQQESRQLARSVAAADEAMGRYLAGEGRGSLLSVLRKSMMRSDASDASPLVIDGYMPAVIIRRSMPCTP